MLKKYTKKTFVEAFIYGDFTEAVSKETLNSFKRETGTTAISREDAFDIKYLVQPNPESLQYVDRLKVNNSCFYREYNMGEDTPKKQSIVSCCKSGDSTTILH